LNTFLLICPFSFLRDGITIAEREGVRRKLDHELDNARDELLWAFHRNDLPPFTYQRLQPYEYRVTMCEARIRNWISVIASGWIER